MRRRAPELVATEPNRAQRPTLSALGLRKTFGKVIAVDGVDLLVAPGEFVTLLGPSGCGKTTLLRMVAGIESPTKGLVRLGATVVTDTDRRVHVPPEKRNLGMVFQSYALWPHMTVSSNVDYPLRRSGTGRLDRLQRTRQALRAVGLDGFGARYPAELSGGQQQRVALARAIVGRPSLLLLDEPLSNLDARLRETMRTELKRLQTDLGLTTIYVTHDQSEALAMSDRVLVMAAGRVLQDDAPETVYRAPADLTVARFMGVQNILPGTMAGPGEVDVNGQRLSGVSTRTPIPQGTAVMVAIRAEGLEVVGQGGSLAGVVDGVEFLGSGYEHSVAFEGGLVLAVRSAHRLGDRGTRLSLGLRADGAVAFPVS